MTSVNRRRRHRRERHRPHVRRIAWCRAGLHDRRRWSRQPDQAVDRHRRLPRRRRDRPSQL